MIKRADAFKPAWWLRGTHMQTVWGTLTRQRRLVEFEREILGTPDADEIILDHLVAPTASVHVVLLHGLEGSSYSVYIQGLLSLIQERGWAATALNFRSCARDPKRLSVKLPNRKARLYHSGETTDLDFVIRSLRTRFPDRRFLAFGASLGGNVLLKWLGEHREESLLQAAATLSVPYDLAAGAKNLESRLGRIYTGGFLRALKLKASDKVQRFPEAAAHIDLPRTLEARTFFEFDDAATAPLHGFEGASDYYERSSSIRFVGRITTPTLCLSAQDDPFLPASVLPALQNAVSDAVALEMTPGGGHIGFVGGHSPFRCVYWAEERIVDWLASRCAE